MEILKSKETIPGKESKMTQEKSKSSNSLSAGDAVAAKTEEKKIYIYNGHMYLLAESQVEKVSINDWKQSRDTLEMINRLAWKTPRDEHGEKRIYTSSQCYFCIPSVADIQLLGKKIQKEDIESTFAAICQ